MDKLNETLIDIFRIDKEDITDELDIRETKHWDSLAHMRFIFSIEEVYGIELDQDEIVKMAKVSDIKTILSARQ